MIYGSTWAKSALKIKKNKMNNKYKKIEEKEEIKEQEQYELEPIGANKDEDGVDINPEDIPF